MVKVDKRALLWWRDLSRQERIRALMRATDIKENASITDAYDLWRQGIISIEPPKSEMDEPVI